MPTGFGGMISLRVKGDLDTARQVMKGLTLFTLAESLGGVESLVESPALMTHMSVDKAVREAIGLTDNLIRLSVGIEAVEDLQADLDQALHAAAIAV
jgi:cystathionine gamma-lyase